MTNPVQLELPDLIGLKAQAKSFALPPNRKFTYLGSGEGRSLFKSRGLNFQEVRQYYPGDDIRQIDWRVTAKYGKPFTKLYEEEKEHQIYILCDLRRSMQFASQGHFKSVVAGRLAALCAFLAEEKNDSLCCQILTNKILSFPSASAKITTPHFLNKLIQTAEEDSSINFKDIFPFITQNIRSGAMLFLISDFNDFSTEELDFLGHLSKKNTINLLHIYDALEINLPKGVFPCSDGKNFTLINTQSENFKKNYLNSWNQQTLLLRKGIQKYGLGYLTLRTDSDYINIFKRFCLGV